VRGFAVFGSRLVRGFAVFGPRLVRGGGLVKNKFGVSIALKYRTSIKDGV